ncbi:MAG: gamma-glutamyl-phosphate reductase [delta proteobacterium ML8_F1]|nr:MAG: gamma-glutamyl-phosphate reductase [delta proteobacterium ML8_F1]
MDVKTVCQQAKAASYSLQALTTEEKNAILLAFGEALKARMKEILKANDEDLAEADKNQMRASLKDRLILDDKRILDMALSLVDLAALKDPVGQVDETWTTAEGLHISKIRVPIGVLGMIYEARPNVTLDAGAIALKTGNTVVLKGGKEAIHTNIALVRILQSTLKAMGHSEHFIQLIESTDRAATMEFMTMKDYVDVLIPRGSERLIKSVMEHSKIPVLETGAGNCHIFVDAESRETMAIPIIDNAKTQRPSVCNAAEKVLVHEAIAESFIPKLHEALKDRVTFKGCGRTLEILPGIEALTEEELYQEFLDYVLGVIVVKDYKAAVDHINQYSSSHSESIITDNPSHAAYFLAHVMSSTVYHNASTRFTDGGMFGYGAEIGISTSKLHARGPMGLKEMTTIKNVVRGTGQIRK